LKFKRLLPSLGPWLNSVKCKLVNFDIKPAKPIVEELFKQVDSSLDAGKYKQAIQPLKKIIAINNRHNYALYALGYVYQNLGELDAAYTVIKRGIKFHPNDHKFYELFGIVQGLRGKLRSGAAAYQRALNLRPDLVVSNYLIYGMRGINLPIASREYIIEVFNDYADYFEKNLVEELRYCAHQQLVVYLRSFWHIETLNLVLDLGCGTGLLGQELSANFKIKRLIGVDLAEKMLAESQKKNIYHQLVQADVIDYLRLNEEKFDLLAATDVFVYIGDLRPVFMQAYKSIRAGGYFGFSVESMQRGQYKLYASGRYKHSLGYITSLSHEFGFSEINSQPIDLRKESGNIVAGYLVLLQK